MIGIRFACSELESAVLDDTGIGLETPEERAERAEIIAQGSRESGVGKHGFDLAAVANDAGILE